jgi:2-polyprenyl-3-methyl-5-hydroxy-6-metoxy-1,4-benzoquinol methylase
MHGTMELAKSQVEALPYLDKPDPWSSHALVKDFLMALPEGTRVLDVGTATGTLGRMCVGHRLILHGIEPQLAWAEQARPYYDKIICCELDEAPESFLKGYDAIILADVLEHLQDPEQSLQWLASLQMPDAQFIISVPNIANLWIRLNLLAGRFNYTPRGILDRTHLRFFTRYTFLQMLENCGLQVQHMSVTPVPLNLIHPFFQTHPVGRFFHTSLAHITRWIPTLLGYQFFVVTGLKNNGR